MQTNADFLKMTVADQEALLAALGIYNGVGTMVAAVMETEDTPSMPPKYGPVFRCGEGIEYGLTPSFAEGELYGSNSAIRKESLVNYYDFKANLARILPNAASLLLGRVTDKNGIGLVSDRNAPYVAVGFEATRDDGTRVLRWLLKGRLKEETVTFKTKSGSVEYQTPTIEGTFIFRRDEVSITLGDQTRKVRPIIASLDTATGEEQAALADTFFDKVYEFGAAVPDPAPASGS